MKAERGRALKYARCSTLSTAGGVALLLRQRGPGALEYDVIRERADTKNRRCGSIEKVLARPKKWSAYDHRGDLIGDAGLIGEATELVWQRWQRHVKSVLDARVAA